MQRFAIKNLNETLNFRQNIFSYVKNCIYSFIVIYALSFLVGYNIIILTLLIGLLLTFKIQVVKYDQQEKDKQALQAIKEMADKLDELNKLEQLKQDKQNLELTKERLENDIKNSISFSQHLSNVISGINHEISPWIGGMTNIITRLDDYLDSIRDDSKIGQNDAANSMKINAFLGKCDLKFPELIKACEQSINVLSSMSSNIKKLQTYSIDSYNLNDTISSWVSLILMDRTVKDAISYENIKIDNDSLDFLTKHSPMLVSQIILNLMKNTVEHNKEQIEHIRINIYGSKNNACLVFEDNGKGIDKESTRKIFEPGFSTKNNKGHKGFGLAACRDYCVNMDAIIWCESEVDNFTRFIIVFNYKNAKKTINDTNFAINADLFEKYKLKKEAESDHYKKIIDTDTFRKLS